jgi:proteasome component ECM29
MLGGRDGRAPATNPVKIRVLYYLGKSIIATNLASHMIQVVFDGIYGKTVI